MVQGFIAKTERPAAAAPILRLAQRIDTPGKTLAWLRTTALLAVLAACSSAPPPPLPPPMAEEQQPPPAEVSASKQNTDTVTLALLRRADARAGAGEVGEAVELIERAIRIEPRRGDLWLRLGELNYQQSRYQAAEQFARKGLLFLPSGSIHERSAWLLIANVREALDDPDAAQQIRDQWQHYRG